MLSVIDNLIFTRMVEILQHCSIVVKLVRRLLVSMCVNTILSLSSLRTMAKLALDWPGLVKTCDSINVNVVRHFFLFLCTY